MIIGNINYSTLNTGNSSLNVRAVDTNKNHLMSAQNLGAVAGDPITTCINAVEIDWNGAVVEDGVVINTTSDLLNWIKSGSDTITSDKLIKSKIKFKDSTETAGAGISTIYQNENGELMIQPSEYLFIDNDIKITGSIYMSDDWQANEGGRDINLCGGRLYFNQSRFIYVDSNGELVYHKDNNNEIILSSAIAGS